MNDGSGGRGGLVWRLWQRAGVLVIVVGLAMLASGCGSGPSPGRDSYEACLRKHGVAGALAAAQRTSLPGPGESVQVPAKVSAAMKACQSLVPRPPGRSSGPG